MAAQIQPPEAPIASPPSTADNATETAAAVPSATATAPTAPTITTAENPGLPLAPKRQRRPSVRLGEIGDQPAHESHARRPTRHPWRLLKDSSSASKAVKARSLTNLVNGNGGADSRDNQDLELEERNNNLYADGNAELGIRKAKAKRGTTTTKRVRSNWLPSPRADEGDSREDGDEGYRDFDPDSDHSPVQSLDNVHWRGQRRQSHTHTQTHTNTGPQSHNRVSELDNLGEDGDRNKWDRGGTNEGVRSWLIELGLSRYAPMFEIHEVDDQVLPMLTLEDLKDMGINAVGSRRKMYTAIQKLRKQLP